ncbi:MAG: hypothetical protein O3A01_01680 [bacterium]|nr:hypothetical protein [bacterium]
MGKLQKFLCLVMLPIIMASFGELLLKWSLNTIDVALDSAGILTMIFNPMVILSVLLIISGGVIWLVAMSKYELSFIYPFLSLNYVIILLGSRAFLGETISTRRVFAIGLIILGLFFISKSPNADSAQDA